MKSYGVLLLLTLCTFQIEASCLKGNCDFGRGKVILANGNVYEGNFNQGLPNGKGIMRYTNGDKYLGRWQHGKRSGEGKLIQRNGDSYVGEWAFDKKNGKGRITKKDGTITRGIWENNVLIEVLEHDTTEATPTYEPSKSQTTSNLINCNSQDCGHGTGKYTYGDGSEYIGSFANGKPHGMGILNYASGNIYEGEWSNHAPNGEGTMIMSTGQKIHAIWNNGNLIKELKFKRNSIKNEIFQEEYSDDTKIWAVIVGIASYNHMPSLKYTDDDAYKMYAFLKSPEGGALPDNQIKILVDDMATKEEILGAMEDVYLRADDNDLIMLYYSGHGLEGSFIPYDFDGSKNTLAHDEINSIFKQSRAKHKVCFADACYSGSYANAKGGVMEAVDDYYSKLQTIESSTAIMMSSQQNEMSLEYMGLRQGIFSHFLMRGLKGEADQNQDKTVTIQELFGFVNQNVKSYTANSQTPILAGSFDRKMPVSFVR